MPRYLPFVLIGLTLVLQVVSGINYVTIPVLMEQQHVSNAWIGVAMATEITGVLLLHKKASHVMQRFGTVRTVLGLVLLRALVCVGMAWQQWYVGWLVVIFLYGLSTGLLLVLLQTWLNLLPLKRRGLIMGLFSASLSLGVGLGPVVLQVLSVTLSQRFDLNAGLCLLQLWLVWLSRGVTLLNTESQGRLKFVFRHARAILIVGLVGGVGFYGLPNFLTLYGLDNGLSPSQAPLLMTTFMLGSVSLGMLISLLSDRISRQWIVVGCVFVSVVCAVFLALAVYANYWAALALLYVWGGSMGGLYSVSLSLIGDRFHSRQQMMANLSYNMMDASGGIVGLISMGLMMDLMGPEGMPFVLVLVGCCFLVYLVWELIKTRAPFQ